MDLVFCSGLLTATRRPGPAQGDRMFLNRRCQLRWARPSVRGSISSTPPLKVVRISCRNRGSSATGYGRYAAAGFSEADPADGRCFSGRTRHGVPLARLGNLQTPTPPQTGTLVQRFYTVGATILYGFPHIGMFLTYKQGFCH